MKKNGEVFISVDIETSGPIPGKYSLLSIGACDAENDTQTFVCELKPTTDIFDPDALKVSGLSLDRLKSEGEDPLQAMMKFRNWISELAGIDGKPVFVGFNASFDWAFINYYFHMFLGENPFGFSALDIKSMYMGSEKCSWADTRSSLMSKKLKPTLAGTHNALDDAKFQAELFRLVRK